ncbi:MAG: aldehyde ferredoxin oxidoreductase C-terminal domain-containing protein, partial [Promethearchaeota archaeon]
MGSKKLKAIVFTGSKRPKINENPEFKRLIKSMLDRFKKKELLYGKDGVYRRLGTPVIVDWTNKLGCFPVRYYTRGYTEYANKINANALIEQILKRRTGCWNCPFTCGKYVEVTTGPYKCALEGPEYETIANFGGLCDIRDIAAIAWINEFCDRVGIDTISAGAVCALAIEAKRRGLIDGLKDVDIGYNSPQKVMNFLVDMVELKGIAADFSKGTKHVANKYELGDFAVHVKGLEFAGYDPRAFRGFALSYGVSPEGATHLRSVFHGMEKDLPDRESYEGKVKLMIEQEDKMAIIDSLIICKFTRGAVDWPFLTTIFNTVYQEEYTIDDLRAIAGSMITKSRLFNIREGFSRKDDYMPERFYKESLPGPHGVLHTLDKNKYDRILDEYYHTRGWSKDGIPKND